MAYIDQHAQLIHAFHHLYAECGKPFVRQVGFGCFIRCAGGPCRRNIVGQGQVPGAPGITTNPVWPGRFRSCGSFHAKHGRDLMLLYSSKKIRVAEYLLILSGLRATTASRLSISRFAKAKGSFRPPSQYTENTCTSILLFPPGEVAVGLPAECLVEYNAFVGSLHQYVVVCVRHNRTEMNTLVRLRYAMQETDGKQK